MKWIKTLGNMFRGKRVEDQMQLTIMEFSVMDRTRPMSFNRPNLEADRVTRVERARFKIRLAGSNPERQNSATVLVEKMYGSRGYESQSNFMDSQSGDDALAMTALVYGNHGEPVGTATLRFDGPGGLLADELYGPELQALRKDGRRLVEYSKFAIDRGYADSRKIVASLMNVFYTSATARGYTDALIEVNPRHVGYYVNRANFECIGEERICPRVNAPAVLLRLDYALVAGKVEQCSERKDDPSASRSLYGFFLVGDDQAALSSKLVNDPASTRK